MGITARAGGVARRCWASETVAGVQGSRGRAEMGMGVSVGPRVHHLPSLSKF